LFVIKHFTKYTLCCRTHLTTLSHLLAVGGVTGTHAHVSGQQRSENFGRGRSSGGKMAARTTPAQPGFLCCKPDDFSETPQRPIFTKFGHSIWIHAHSKILRFSKIFRLGVICPPKNSTLKGVKEAPCSDQPTAHGTPCREMSFIDLVVQGPGSLRRRPTF